MAAELGFDLSQSRILCLFDIEQAGRNIANQNQLLFSICQTIKNFSLVSSQDIIGPLGNEQIVFCHVIHPQTMEQSDLKRRLPDLYMQIAGNYSVSLSLSVGLFAQKVPEYGQSLSAAQSALTHINPEDSLKIVFAEDYLAEYMLQQVPASTLDHFLGHYIRTLNDNPVLYETIEALIINNMDIYATAKYLYIHRNTVIFRVSQIKKLFKLNPLHKDNDRFQLIIISLYYKMLANEL